MIVLGNPRVARPRLICYQLAAAALFASQQGIDIKPVGGCADHSRMIK